MNKKIKILILILILFLLAGTLSYFLFFLKKEKKIYRVGILGGVADFIDIANGFRAKMTELGYIEGKNIIYEVKSGNFDQTELEKIAKKFVEEKVDLIFVYPTEAAVIAKNVTKGTNIPVIFGLAGIEGTNLVESISKPGGNITGIRYPGPDLVIKRLEFLLKIAPNIKRIYVPYDPNYPTVPPALAALRSAALFYGINLVEIQIHSVEELQEALKKQSETVDSKTDAIQILPDYLTQIPAGWEIIRNFAEENKIPLVGSALSTVEKGGILAFCVDFFEIGKLAAPLADKVLKGTPAGEIMVVTSPGHLWLNYRKAQELGLTVPADLLSMAEKIIR